MHECMVFPVSLEGLLLLMVARSARVFESSVKEYVHAMMIAFTVSEPTPVG
jgi:hypothetical protein